MDEPTRRRLHPFEKYMLIPAKILIVAGTFYEAYRLVHWPVATGLATGLVFAFSLGRTYGLYERERNGRSLSE